MRSLTMGIALVAMLMLLSTYTAGKPAPQSKADKAATVAELEKTGDLARAQKDYSKAAESFRAALRVDRKNSRLYNKLGMADLSKNDLRSARQDFEKAAKFNPKFSDAISNIGAVDYIAKKYGSAEKYFKRAVALDESRSSYHINLGAVWFAQGKLDRAIAEYTRAVELDPEILKQDSRSGVVAQIASAEERAKYSYMLAKIYARRGDLDNCLECLKKAKEEGYRNLANVYKEEDFNKLRQDPRLHDIVPPPVQK